MYYFITSNNFPKFIWWPLLNTMLMKMFIRLLIIWYFWLFLVPLNMSTVPWNEKKIISILNSCSNRFEQSLLSKRFWISQNLSGVRKSWSFQSLPKNLTHFRLQRIYFLGKTNTLSSNQFSSILVAWQHLMKTFLALQILKVQFLHSRPIVL